MKMIDLGQLFGRVIVKEIAGAELERHTKEGWLLLGMGTESVPESIFDTEAVNPGGYNTGGGGYVPPATTMQVTRHVVTGRLKYLVGLSPDSQLADLTEQIRKHVEKDKVAFEAMKEMEKVVNAEKAQAATLTRELDRYKKLTTDAVEAGEKVKDHARKMEADIAKLRTAIGEREMKRILEPTI